MGSGKETPRRSLASRPSPRSAAERLVSRLPGLILESQARSVARSPDPPSLMLLHARYILGLRAFSHIRNDRLDLVGVRLSLAATGQ